MSRRPILINTSDWHLTENTPVCRTDDYMKAQWKKLDFIKDLQKELSCPVVHNGDLFDHWKPSPALISEVIDHMPKQFITVYGNHCLPQHSMELYKKSGVYTLQQAGALTTQQDGSFGYSEIGYLAELSTLAKRLIGIQHIFLYKGQIPWPDCPFESAVRFMERNSSYDLFLTGDNHTTFTVIRKGKILINPGSLMRMTGAQVDHKPCVFIYYSDHTIEKVFLPIEEGVVSREHLEQVSEKNARIDAFISRIKDDAQPEFSFEDNLEQFFASNKTPSDVKQLIYTSLEAQ